MTLTKNLRYFIPGALVLMGLCLAANVYANPFYTGPTAASATATTTLAYMTSGLATSTTVYDSYEQSGTNQPNSGNVTRPDDVDIAIQGVASSSITTVNVACEYSQDNIDWYQNQGFSTTTTTNMAVPLSFNFVYASSTSGVGGQGISATYNKFAKVFVCPVLMRYVRSVVTVSGTNAGIGIYTAIIPKKQRN